MSLAPPQDWHRESRARLWHKIPRGALADGALNVPGVYVTYLNGRVNYVGQSSGNIRCRLITHARRFAFDSVKVTIERDKKKRQALERRLIYRLRPINNRVIPASSREAGIGRRGHYDPKVSEQ